LRKHNSTHCKGHQKSVMKITIQGVKSLSQANQSILLNGMTIITGANSSGKSSFLLGLRFLEFFLSNQHSRKGKDLIHKIVNIQEIHPSYNKTNFSNGKSINIDIEFNKFTGLCVKLVFTPIDEYHYCLQHLEFGFPNRICSVRTTLVYEDDLNVYSFLAPIWNTLSILAGKKTFKSELNAIIKPKQKSEATDKKPEFNWILGHVAKLNAYNLGSEVYETDLLSKALSLFFVALLKNEVFSIKTAQVISEYIRLFENGSISEDLKNRVYSSAEFGGPSNNSSDFNVLITSIESMLTHFVQKASKQDKNFIREFEKTTFSEIVWELGEKKLIRDDIKLSQDSPIAIASSFIAEFWDYLLETFLQNVELNIYDKISIEPKAYFTSGDQELFSSINHIYNQLNNVTIRKHFLITQFKKLTKIGLELILENHVNDSIKTIKVKLPDKSIVEVHSLGTGHFFLIALYLKLLSFLVAIKEVDYEKKIVTKKIGASAKRILLLIEPESFLHPSAQVQLADLLCYFADQGLRMVIETHSEHLIRAIQLKVAKKEIMNQKINLYYFENINGTSIRKIRIDSRGFLLDKFGTGFLDETPRLIQDFFKVNKN
jgi:predicted ATPase